MMNLPFVSVIVPTYRDKHALISCLQSLAAQDYPHDSYEVIIVNNDPSSQIEIPKLNCKTVLICESKPGSYSARNAGLKIANGELIAFTDADCLAQNDWIRHGVQKMLCNPDVSRVAGLVKLFKADGASNLVWRYEATTAFNQKYNVSKGLSVTANLFVRKEAFDLVGTFNETLLSGGDMEWNSRAEKLQLPIALSHDAVVLHPARSSFNELITKHKRITGGLFNRAVSEKTLASFFLRLIIPPLPYCVTLLKDGKPIVDVFISGCIMWGIRLYMILEYIKLLLGKKPAR